MLLFFATWHYFLLQWIEAAHANFRRNTYQHMFMIRYNMAFYDMAFYDMDSLIIADIIFTPLLRMCQFIGFLHHCNHLYYYNSGLDTAIIIVQVIFCITQ